MNAKINYGEVAKFAKSLVGAGLVPASVLAPTYPSDCMDGKRLVDWVSRTHDVFADRIDNYSVLAQVFARLSAALWGKGLDVNGQWSDAMELVRRGAEIRATEIRESLPTVAAHWPNQESWSVALDLLLDCQPCGAAITA